MAQVLTGRQGRERERKKGLGPALSSEEVVQGMVQWVLGKWESEKWILKYQV